MVSMTKYRQRTISFTLPRDEEALETFDRLSEDHRGNSNAGHYLLKFYMNNDLEKWTDEQLIEELQKRPELMKEIVEVILK